MFKRLAMILPFFSLLLVVGCGVSDEAITEAEAHLEDLKSRGVPEDELSRPTVFLYQARESSRTGNSRDAKQAYDSALYHIEKAQNLYDEQIATLMPTINSNLEKVNEAREELSGMQVRKIDSTIAIIDSFINIEWLLQANNVAVELKESLPQLKEDEERASELSSRVPGVWRSQQRTTSRQHREVNALEEKFFSFFRDGRAKLVEQKKGQSGPYLKEDWKFESEGTYELAGDTIFLFISRFASIKQDFERIHNVDGEPVWKSEPAPTYDSTITDGSQDRFILWEDLEDDFTRIRRL
ncbi:hypothetical protein QA601_01130 [Chitinispirillales bacterium ANBcel5]|uniref:hypothetical protein n=1 Tax=Cellulosispirillum alkaliphilum TaxID=3039283 RepID=UPI002A50E5F3|nr:hypothetical protein [Chitinispirillales bacterium ANBcel5]